MLATALGVAAWPATASRDATLMRPAELPDAECIGFIGGQEATGGTTAATTTTQTPPVLMEGLGFAGLEPDSQNAEARAWFAQGVRLIWAFDEVEAIRAFQQAQRLDPNCAMCFLGEAWARGPTINLQPRTDELAAARTAAQRAKALGANLSARDRILVEAMMLRTGPGNAFRNAAYASFMETQALRHPDDDLLNIMAADARMITWDEDNEPRPGNLAQRFLERVLARNPDHGGAIHYYIHLTDWIDRQHLAVPYAERLGRVAPAASHLVHMPSHTFYGVGRYADAARVNVLAVAADQAFRTRARPAASDYRFGLNAHNMHFAIESALARGDGETAQSVSRQYRETYMSGPRDNRTAMLGTATYYTLGLHGEVGAVLARAMPEHVFDKVQLHYARGEALARRGDAAGVRAEAAAIAALREGRESPALVRNSGKLAEVFQHVLEGRAAMLANNPAAAQTAYRRAMEVQLAAGWGSDPPLYWYSVRRSLAAATLAAGDARGAREQIYASLRRWPNDALALYVLSQADRAAGDTASAERNLARARALWASDVTQVPLARI
jgi:tetratricopeptide (TPR) repeat protein